MTAKEHIHSVLEQVVQRNPGEVEFHQAVKEVLESLEPVISTRPEYVEANILGRIVEPERVIIFRVPWQDDRGQVHVNRGFRVQFNSTLGPYKGGIRFHPSVNQGIIKFLGFEQTFKNSLTTMPIGGGKGGSDFDPKFKSETEIMRFCQSFMTELQRHIGIDTDVPAGDIGAGAREVGFMFGQYKRLRNEFTGVFTGKGPSWGGSHIRPEATGYGAVYFAQEMLRSRSEGMQGKICVVSGSGNVAQHIVEKLNELGGRVVALSDSDGSIYDPQGIDEEKLRFVMELKRIRGGRIKEYADRFKGVEYHKGLRPWAIECDCAFPSATQNEISLSDAQSLSKNECRLICEGANMPTEPEAINLTLSSNCLFGPSKAANAGGVAVSALEMSQNSMRLKWSREEVDSKLKEIMKAIYRQCAEAAEEYGMEGNLAAGANIAGFVRVADAMLDHGVV